VVLQAVADEPMELTPMGKDKVLASNSAQRLLVEVLLKCDAASRTTATLAALAARYSWVLLRLYQVQQQILMSLEWMTRPLHAARMHNSFLRDLP
jgi:hypothetical protein